MAQKLKSAGCHLLCYIATTYAQKSEQKVLDELSKYTAQYPNTFEGVFFDEMKTEEAKYYASLTRQVHQRGLPLVIANPGGAVPDTYFSALPGNNRGTKVDQQQQQRCEEAEGEEQR